MYKGKISHMSQHRASLLENFLVWSVILLINTNLLNLQQKHEKIINHFTWFTKYVYRDFNTNQI